MSDSLLLVAIFAPGLGSGGGREKSLEVLRSLPVGDSRLAGIADKTQMSVDSRIGRSV